MSGGASTLNAMSEVEAVNVRGTTFGDRIADAVDRKQSQVLVGLDPRPELFPVELRGEPPAEASARFCRGIIDAVAAYVVGVKPQLAFFEALGSPGLAAFEEVCDYARAAGLVVLADGKRGDIGSTARAYAAAYLEPRGEGAEPVADALTVNPVPGAGLGRSVPGGLPPARPRDLLRRQDLERRRRGDPGPRPLRRPTALAARRLAGRRVGSRRRRRARPVERWSRHRRDAPARGCRGAQVAAAIRVVAARSRRPGSETRRRGQSVHERTGQRARRGSAFGHLCLSPG